MIALASDPHYATSSLVNLTHSLPDANGEEIADDHFKSNFVHENLQFRIFSLESVPWSAIYEKT